MGKGLRWSSEECEVLATAWINVSEDKDMDDVKGTNQTIDSFWKRVRETIGVIIGKVVTEKKLPVEDVVGKYHHRELNAIKTCWNEKIQRDVKKFNRSLLKVYSAHLTGVTEQQKKNIAVAITMGKTDAAHYRFKDYEPNNWMYYKAWHVLKEHPSFLPPKAKKDDGESDEETDLEEGEQEPPNNTPGTTMPEFIPEEGGEVNPKVSDLSTGSEANGPSVARRSRGPGPGKKVSAAVKMADENAKRRLDLLERIVIASEDVAYTNRKKQRNVAMFVANNSRASAVKSAYLIQKAGTTSKADKKYYGDLMRKALSAKSDEEDNKSDEEDNNIGEDDEMPPLEGV
jgi:hypothetical protein